MSWVYLAISAPILFAIINLIDDHMLRHVYRSPHSGAIISSIFGGLPLVSLLFLDTKPITALPMACAFLAGYALSIMYFFYFRSLDIEAPSVVVSILSLAPVVLAVVGYFLFDERLSAGQILGGLVIILSSIALAGAKKDGRRNTLAIVYMLSAVAALCVYSLFSKYAYDNADFYTAYMFMSLGLVAGGVYFLFYIYYADRKYMLRDLGLSFKKYFHIFLLTELLALGAEFISSLAVSRGSVTIVRVLENTQPLFVLLIAVVLSPLKPKLFREVNEGAIARKMLLLTCMAAGLFLVGYSTL